MGGVLSMSEPVKIAIIIEDGMVQQVLTMGLPVECVVVDYDTDGADESALTQTDDGPAYVSKWTADDSAECREFVAYIHRIANEEGEG